MFDMKLMGCMVELENEGFRNGKLGVLKCLGQTVLRPRWGRQEGLGWFLCSGREQAGVQDLGY